MREVPKEKKKLSEKVSEGLDEVIGIFSPQASVRRKFFRWISKKYSFSSYRGAEKDRLKKSWLPGGGSADADLLAELPDLRERSRDLNRNDAHASGITGTVVTNVVGTGIRPQSRVDKESLGITDEEANLFQRKAERVWQKWCPYADSGNRMYFYEIQKLIERQILENGEVIFLPVMIDEPGRPYMFALEVVESDRLQTPLDKRSDKNIRHGVELGSRGEPVAYWIRKTHPGDGTLSSSSGKATEYVRYPAKNKFGMPNVYHLYWVLRPGQTRGVPFFASVMTQFKDLADYLEAELVAARVAACFAAFITKADPYQASLNRADSTNAQGQKIEELEPGMVEYLAPGEKVEGFNPQRPGGSFDPFVERMLRAIGAGLGLPYEIVAKDFSRTNYSSARAALLEAWRFFKGEQEWLANRFCQPCWEVLLMEAFLRNELPVENFIENRLDWVRARWITPGRGWIDPTKEVEAARGSIDGGISTLADECAAAGKDWEETLEQRAREEAKRKELGLPDMRQNAGKDGPKEEDEKEMEEVEK